MIGFLYALCSSRIGRTLIAIKQNEPLVRAQGISPMPYKLASFAISAAITGAAGGVYCLPPAASSIRCSSTSITCRPS